MTDAQRGAGGDARRDSRRALPAVHALLSEPAIERLLGAVPRAAVTDAARRVVAAARAGRGETPQTPEAWAALIEQDLAVTWRSSLRRVINATGVVLHTNLGRAPLAPEAIAAIAQVAGGYANVEYDLDRGERGSRSDHARALLCELTGAEDAFVVNNCAAAIVLALRALAEGSDALISRGELIEIGGSFRVPEIMGQANVRLVEVGTTNRTHLDDYRRALDANTRMVVKVHRSNFTMEGFVADVPPRDLVALAREADVPLLVDFGSGLMLDLGSWGLSGEPTAREMVATGADLVVMSGDKLLGGPQAGIVVGRSDAIASLRTHPLARALRVDKLTLAALEATLLLYRDPAAAARTIPTLAALTEPVESVRVRADALAARLRAGGVSAAVADCAGAVGGGAFPAAKLASAGIRLDGDAAQWESRLRSADIPVITRVVDGACLLDLRTVLLDDEPDLLRAVLRAARGSAR